jgi:hypothetical protein
MKQLYKGFHKKDFWCKIGFHDYIRPNDGYTITEKSIEKYPLLSQQVKYFLKYKSYPKDSIYELRICSKCSKEKVGKLITKLQ